MEELPVGESTYDHPFSSRFRSPTSRFLAALLPPLFDVSKQQPYFRAPPPHAHAHYNIMVAAPDVDSVSDDNALSVSFDDALDYNTPPDALVAERIILTDGPSVELLHPTLHTSFVGVEHYVSDSRTKVHQFRGIKYANVPLRFRRSVLFDKYEATTDATKYGYVTCASYFHNIDLEMTLGLYALR